MRILYISNTTSGGGAPSSLFNLVDSLKDSHDVAVVLPEASGPLYDRLKSRGIRCYTSCSYILDVWPRVLNPVKFFSRLAALSRNRTAVRKYIGQVIDDFRPDIVHTNVGPLAIACEECRRRGIPHVWHHREYQDRDFSMTFFPSRKSFLDLVHSEGNYNIAITRDIFRHWQLREGTDTYIYNGIRQSRTSADVSGPKGLSAADGYFLYAGRIEKAKGLMMLLKAYRIYRREGGRYNLLVAGKPCGIDAALCRLYVSLHSLGDSVSFLGQRSDVRDLMAGAVAFVMCSKAEGFGLVTVEAMLGHCLVIGRDTAGTKEQFDRGLELTGKEIGLRFRTVGELAEQLHRASEEGYEDMKEAAFGVASDCYTVSRYASDVEAYYHKVLAMSGLDVKEGSLSSAQTSVPED